MIRRAATAVAHGLGAALLALAVLGFLHQDLDLVGALACAAVGVGVGAALRGGWAGLPPFVAVPIAAGVVATGVLVAAATTGLSHGWPYLVLRWPAVAALGSAAALTGTATAALGYTHRRLARDVAAAGARAAQLEARALESRLHLLSAQIDPHLLFNTLNTLAELVHLDPDRAEDLVTDLAATMRHALGSSTRRVPLADELDVVRRLLRIEGARLGDRLSWRVEVGEGTERVEVPGLLVQPLVENAVRHGVAPRPEGGRVEVVSERRGDRVVVTVTDDGPGLSAEVAAAAVHAWSQRTGALCAVDCGAVPESLFESTFFGHRRGAFTGATEAREGEIARAQL
ncbi:MAG: histidine kinase, partial [Myxococcota bacterium]